MRDSVREREGCFHQNRWSDRPRDEIAKDLATAWILAGDWARAFIEGFQERPSETRLVTEIIHLFINGLMYTRQEESTI